MSRPCWMALVGIVVVTMSLSIRLVAQGPIGLGIQRAPAPALGKPDAVNIGMSDRPTVLQQLVEHAIYQAIPREYEDTKKWGKTKEVFDGWHIKADGLKVSTKRKKKLVRQGTWKRYHITMVDPNKSLRVRLMDPRTLPSGALAAEVLIGAKLDLQARMQEWQRDIRLFSVTAEASADVELWIKATATTSVAPHVLTSDLILDPHVEQAELRLLTFKLRRLSKADGVLIREFGDGIEPVLEELLEEKSEGLAEKLNRQIAKNREKFRLSPADPLRGAFQAWFSPNDRD